MPIHWSTDDSPHFEFVRSEANVRQGLQKGGVTYWITGYGNVFA